LDRRDGIVHLDVGIAEIVEGFDPLPLHFQKGQLNQPVVLQIRAGSLDIDEIVGRTHLLLLIYRV